MKIRLTGLPAEAEDAITTISTLPGFDVTEISGPYPNRGASRLVRFYLEVRLINRETRRPAAARQGDSRMKTQQKDYYAILGITQDATMAEIKKAYRRLARKHHPDKNPDDPHAAERFRDLTEACDVLTDPARREAYDRDYQPAPGARSPRRWPTATPSAACRRARNDLGRPSGPGTPKYPPW